MKILDELYYGNIDISEYIRDKRDPQVYDGNLNRFRFVPADGSKETWILQGSMHCTGFGAGPDELTADYPYYIEFVGSETIGKQLEAGIKYAWNHPELIEPLNASFIPVSIARMEDVDDLWDETIALWDNIENIDGKINNLVPVDRWESTNIEIMNSINRIDETIGDINNILETI